MPTRDAAQLYKAVARSYDAYLASCPARQLVDRICDKWVTLILPADGPPRYSDLAGRIACEVTSARAVYDTCNDR